MSKSTSDNRTCEKCGYILSPFETECPKCAHLAAEHPAASDAPADQPIAPAQFEVRRIPVLHRRPLAIAGAIGFILATVIIGALLLPSFLENVGGSQTFNRLYLIAASLIAIFLGYLLGIPSLWEEEWRNWIYLIFAAIVLCFGFLVLGFFAAMLANDSGAGIMLVGLFFAGIFYLISSAALSHVLHTQPDRKLSALGDLLIVGGIISYFIILKALH